jgi:hypothetical protein
VRPGDIPEGMMQRAEEALRKNSARGGNCTIVVE